MQYVVDGSAIRKRGNPTPAYCLAIPLRATLRSRSCHVYRINANTRLLEKRCARCDQWFPADSRYFSRQSWERHHAYCKGCVQERVPEIRAFHADGAQSHKEATA